jgi:hypothetical protein
MFLKDCKKKIQSQLTMVCKTPCIYCLVSYRKSLPIPDPDHVSLAVCFIYVFYLMYLNLQLYAY